MGDRGVVLVNVLVVLAIAAGLVEVKLDAQDRGRLRERLTSGRSQATELALGAEATARAALRQDMIDGARSDHMAKTWTGVTQRDVSLETGWLAVAVTDAHARFGIIWLAARNLADAEMLVRIARTSGLSRDRAVAIGGPRCGDGLGRAAV